MSDLLHKIGPVVVVSIIFTWVCWPYITGAATSIGSNGNGNSIALPNNLLSPSVKDPNQRDPFQVVKSAAMNMIQGKLAGTKDKTPEYVDPEKEQTTGTTANRENAFALTGVYIQGNNRMAILNGALYRIGENIKGSEIAGKPWVLKQILSDRVVVSRGKNNKVVKISFPAVTQSAAQTVETTTPAGSPPTHSESPTEKPKRQLKSITSLDELFEAVRERK